MQIVNKESQRRERKTGEADKCIYKVRGEPCCPGHKATEFITLKELKERIENKRDSKDEMATVMTPSTPPNRRQKWTKQQYKEIIWAYQ